MKQIILTVMLLAIALALILSVVIPLFQHGSDTGNNAVTNGRANIQKVGQILK